MTAQTTKQDIINDLKIRLKTAEDKMKLIPPEVTMSRKHEHQTQRAKYWHFHKISSSITNVLINCYDADI